MVNITVTAETAKKTEVLRGMATSPTWHCFLTVRYLSLAAVETSLGRSHRKELLLKPSCQPNYWSSSTCEAIQAIIRCFGLLSFFPR